MDPIKCLHTLVLIFIILDFHGHQTIAETTCPEDTTEPDVEGGASPLADLTFTVTTTVKITTAAATRSRTSTTCTTPPSPTTTTIPTCTPPPTAPTTTPTTSPTTTTAPLTTTTAPPTTTTAPPTTTTAPQTTTTAPLTTTTAPPPTTTAPLTTTTAPPTTTTTAPPTTTTAPPTTTTTAPPSTTTTAPTTTTTAPPTTTTAPLTSTTTLPDTTTAEQGYCYYSLHRPASLSPSITKRLFSPTAVPTECDYPGIVGLFRTNGGTLEMVCTGLLLDHETIVVEAFCMNYVNTYVVYAHATSYMITNLSTNNPTVVAGTAKDLTPGAILQTVQLSSPLTFDNRCVQPICYPNAAITASDIDFTDCRVVGYGYINDNDDLPTTLMEIRGYVTQDSVTTATLDFYRNDGQTGKICLSDNTAPLICSHLVSGEYVTVGIAATIGLSCSTQNMIKSSFANALQESSKKAYFNNLNKFPYANRA